MQEQTSRLISQRAVHAAAGTLAACALLVAQPAAAHPLDALRSLPSLGAYLALGVHHILTGYDHLLFIAGLVVAAQRVRELLWTVTAFTLAHSVTLALSMFDLVTPNAVVIEVLIALSIAYVGLDNLRSEGPVRGRYWLTFGFGLVHGFGFASALREIGLPPAREFGALALFNLGVESGQLLVLLPLVGVVWRVRRSARARVWVPRGVNLALIATGLFWTVQRTAAPGPRRPAVVAGAAEQRVAPARPALAAEVDERVMRWVEPLCDAFQTLPRQRRAECTGQQPGALLTSQCTRLLANAVRSGALTFAPDQAERCVGAMQTRYQGCEWTTATSQPQVQECRALLRGSKAAGASCNSSLECTATLHCQGVGPLDAGVCAAPAPAGTRCEVGVDPLAAYVPDDATARPECAGSCVRGRCAEASRASL